MKVVIIVAAVLVTLFCFAFILAFLAGASASKTALDQMLDDLEQEKWLRKWKAENGKSLSGDSDKSGGGHFVDNVEDPNIKGK